MSKKLIYLMSFVLLLAVTGTVLANQQIIIVPDAGFDDHVLAEGDWVYIGEGAYAETSDYTGPWQSAGGDAWIDYGYYAADADLPALSGNNKLYGYEESEDYVYQILDETFIEGATYTLSVSVGEPWEGYDDNWSLYFTGDDYTDELASISGNGPIGEWGQATLVHTATAADAGKRIGIKLKGDQYVNFEDVTLSYVTIFLADDFESYADDAELIAAGWTIVDTPEAIEASTWTITNPAGRTNPATLDGSASTGKFLISDSDQQSESNPVDSGASHDITTPSFSTLGYETVWLHADVSAQLNNNGAAIFDVEVSTDSGVTWTNVFSRVAPGRASAEGATTRLPDNTNTDGFFGRLDVDLSAVAPNEPDVQVRFRHFEPNWDWWIAIDNILIDDVPAPQGGNITVLSEDFSNGLGQMSAVSGQGNTGTETWHTTDKGGRYVPGVVQEQGVNRLGPHPNEHPEFAIIDSDADPDPAEDELLMTPVLDLSAFAEVFLHYDSETIVYDDTAAQEVLISLDGGNTFEATPIFNYNGGGLWDSGEEPFYAERIFDVSGVAAGQSQVVFAFRYAGDGNDWFWAVDNVKVSGTLSDGENLLANGSFEEDEAILDDPDWFQWVTWNPAEGAGSNATIVDTDAADGARSLFIEPIGTANWHFIVLYMPIPTEVGASYTTTFWARAAEPRTFGAQYKATDNSVQWGSAEFNLTTEWAEYSLTAEAQNAETKLEFFCAGVEVSLSLDSVSVYKSGDAPAADDPPDGQVENLALNPSFEEDEDILDDSTWTAWCTWNPAEGAGSNVTIVDTESVDGARSLRVEPVGTENGHFIVANISFPLELGADYTFTFWAKAEAPRPLTASFKAADNSVSWGFTDFELTTEWAEYSLTATSESDAGKLEFLCAAVEVPFWLDDVSAYKAE